MINLSFFRFARTQAVLTFGSLVFLMTSWVCPSSFSSIEKEETSSGSVTLLAAGLGSRMKSSLPKVLHPILGKPMIYHMLSAVNGAAPESSVALVVGYQRELVQDYVRDEADLSGMKISYVVQDQQVGTGHATRCAVDSEWGRDQIQEGKPILVLPGDLPLIPQELISQMLQPLKNGAALRLLTCYLDEPEGYGRILRSDSPDGAVLRIVEEKDATDEIRQIKEVGLSTYLFDSQFLSENLPLIQDNNAQGEYYLTDLIEIARQQNREIEVLIWPNSDDVRNVNTPEQLQEAHEIMSTRDLR